MDIPTSSHQTLKLSHPNTVRHHILLLYLSFWCPIPIHRLFTPKSTIVSMNSSGIQSFLSYTWTLYPRGSTSPRHPLDQHALPSRQGQNILNPYQPQKPESKRIVSSYALLLGLATIFRSLVSKACRISSARFIQPHFS